MEHPAELVGLKRLGQLQQEGLKAPGADIGQNGRQLKRTHAGIDANLAQLVSKTLYFYSDSDGGEVDLIVGIGVCSDLIECKSTETPTPKDAAAMQQCAGLMDGSGGARVHSQVIACRALVPCPLRAGCLAVNGLEVAASLGR